MSSLGGRTPALFPPSGLQTLPHQVPISHENYLLQFFTHKFLSTESEAKNRSKLQNPLKPSKLSAQKMLRQSVKHQRRTISSSISYPTVKYNNAPNLNLSKESLYQQNAKLKIDLLKAPMHFGHSTNRMMRRYNEDRFAVNFIDLPIKLNDYGMDQTIRFQNTFIASIFDGHGGDTCSSFLKDHLHKEIEICHEPEDKEEFFDILKTYYENIGGYWKRIYKKRDSFYRSLLEGSNDHNHQVELDDVHDDLNLRLTKTYLNLDYNFLTQNARQGSGSTSTTALIYNLNIRDTKSLYFEKSVISKLIISQIGDTKAIICDKDGEAHSLNSIHHPTSFIESQRLSKFSAGFMTDSFGENRFLNYENTRSFGDLTAKSKGITAEPDITSYIIGDSHTIQQNNLIDQTVGKKGGDECFLVLVTDGITNYATDQEIVDLVMSKYNNRLGKPQDCSDEVVKYVEAIGGDDNATCLVIRLSNWGNWPLIDRTGGLREEKIKAGISKMEKR